MRVDSNVSAMMAARYNRSYSTAFAVSAERIASGRRVNRPSDDPAAFSASSALQTKINGMAQAQRNIGAATAVIGVAQNGATAIYDLLNELRDAITLGPSAAADVVDLVADINTAANDTQYNGAKLLAGVFGAMQATTVFDVTSIVGGTADSLDFGVGSLGSVSVNLTSGTTYTAATLTTAVQAAFAASPITAISDLASKVTVTSSGYGSVERFAFKLDVDPGTTLTVARPSAAPGSWVASSTTASSGATARFQVGPEAGDRLDVALLNMTSDGFGLDTIDLSTPAGIAEALTAVNAALTATTDSQVSMGIATRTLASRLTFMQDQEEILGDMNSRLVGTDYAAEAASMTRNETMMQISAEMVARVNALPNPILRLFNM